MTTYVFSSIILLDSFFSGADFVSGTGLVTSLSSDEEFPTEKEVPIVALNTRADEGIMGILNVRIISGNSNVLIDTMPFLETDLQFSANMAVAVAKETTGIRAPDKDVIMTFDIKSNIIGGESAGAAATLAVIAALDGREINESVAITGTIRRDGSIGRVSGIMEKARTVSEMGFTKFLVPKDQSTVTYYSARGPFSDPPRSGEELVPRTRDVAKIAKDYWNLEIIEVETIDDVIDHMLLPKQ
ncbi:MAG: S16 family serine protease [Candidatus Woesearchaeota archaeon]